MKVLKINANRPERKLLRLAANVLRNGGLVVYPTDTLYGIGANALDGKAVRKVYKAKGREFKKPLSIAFGSLRQAQKYAKFDGYSLKIARKSLPGPLTLILPMKRKFPGGLAREKVGVRVPDSKIAIELLKIVEFPITATSANLAGRKGPATAKDAISQIGDKVDLVIDGGRCKYRKPSTVVEAVGKEIRILRAGVVGESKLKN